MLGTGCNGKVAVKTNSGSIIVCSLFLEMNRIVGADTTSTENTIPVWIIEIIDILTMNRFHGILWLLVYWLVIYQYGTPIVQKPIQG
jgi:hypothetical protein